MGPETRASSISGDSTTYGPTPPRAQLSPPYQSQLLISLPTLPREAMTYQLKTRLKSIYSSQDL